MNEQQYNTIHQISTTHNNLQAKNIRIYLASISMNKFWNRSIAEAHHYV